MIRQKKAEMTILWGTGHVQAAQGQGSVIEKKLPLGSQQIMNSCVIASLAHPHVRDQPLTGKNDE